MSASCSETLKDFQNNCQDITKISKTIQDNVLKLKKIKNEKDSNATKDTLQKQLRESTDLVKQIEAKISSLEDELFRGKEESLPSPKKAEDTSVKDSTPSNKKSSTKPKLSPEEQEISYEHKAQMMRNLEGPNRSLHTEIALQERMNQIRQLNQRNRKLNEECCLSEANAMKCFPKFERKAKELEQELLKSRQISQKYKDMYMLERQKNQGKPEVQETNPKKEKTGADSLLGSSVSVNDIIRRNERLVEENAGLQREIARLKQDNAFLLKRAKDKTADKHSLLQNLNRSESARMELLKKFNRERKQHNQLRNSLTRQASDWIRMRREQQQLQEDMRYRQISPISSFGGYPCSAYQSQRVQNESTT